MKTVRVFVTGDVIGVGFRAWAAIQAKELGIKGWVKNVFDNPSFYGPDGGVEALLQGEDDNVEEMIERLEEGPPVAIVSDVDVKNEKAGEKFESFEILK